MASPSSVVSEYFANLEKKQRNLLKRKVRLDSYKDMLKKGQVLTSDQEKAVAEYDQVCQSIASQKETIDILGEIQTKIDQSVQESEKRMEAIREEYAIDVLQKLVPILDLLSKLRSPAVKAAVTKTTSQQQCALLDNVSKGSIISLPTTTDIETDSSEAFKAPAMFLLKLAKSDTSPINGKSKAVSYSDIRKLCLSLLADEQVRSALASPFAEIPKKKSSVASKETPKAIESFPSSTDPKDKPASDSDAPKSDSIPPSQFPETLPAEVILKSVINPLKTSFNFLQASHVNTVPVLPVPSPPQEVLKHQTPDNQETPAIKPQTSTTQGTIEASDLSDQNIHQEIHPFKAPYDNDEHMGDPVPKTHPTANEKVKRRSVRRGGGNKESNHRAPGRVSPQETANSDAIQQHRAPRRSVGSKSWADRARGFENALTSESPVEVVQAKPEYHENGHAAPRKTKSPSYIQVNVDEEGIVRPPNARPNGGHRGGGGYRGGPGGRGRGGNGQFKGGRGRGAHRGSFHSRGDHHTGDAVHTNQPIQSMC